MLELQIRPKDIFQISSFLFAVVLIILNYSRFIPIPEWILTLLVIILIVGLLISHHIRPFFRRRKSDRKVTQLLRLTSDIRHLTRPHKLLKQSREILNKSASEIAWTFFKEEIDKYKSGYKVIFYCNLLSKSTFSSQKIKSEFFTEIEDHFKNSFRLHSKLRPVIFTAQKYWSDIEDRPQVKEEDESDSYRFFRKADRKISVTDFDGNFCIVIPLTFHSAFQTEPGIRQQLFGYIGLIDNDHITTNIVEQFTNVADRFEELYEKIKVEKVRFHIDNDLNQSHAQRFELAAEKSISALTLFAIELSKTLQKEFYADRVEIWLKGMKLNPSESIFEIVDKISKNNELEEVTGSVMNLPNYHNSCLIELDKCLLGYIRILRDAFDFSEIEQHLLIEIEDIIDNYVRDLWEENIIREIDHNVFNRAEADLGDFARLFIKHITNEFDCYCGLLEIHDRPELFYVQPDYDTNAGIDILKALKEKLQNSQYHKLDKHFNSYYLFMPLSIDKGEQLGAIYLIGKTILTDVHLKALKRVEAHVDNIIKLYLTLEKKYQSM